MKKLDSLANPTVKPNKELVFDYTEFNAGEIREDDIEQIYHFNFTNTGNTPMVILKVSSSCGCIVTDFSKKPVAAGARGRVSVGFNPKGYPGPLNRQVFVYINSPATPSARLTLKGNVKQVGEIWRGFEVALGTTLRARSNVMVFSEMVGEQVKTERIECVNTGTTDMQLEAMTELLPEYISFCTEPKIIGPGKTGDLVVTIDGAKIGIPADKSEKRAVLFTNIGGKTPCYKLNIEIGFK